MDVDKHAGVESVKKYRIGTYNKEAFLFYGEGRRGDFKF